MITQLNYFYLGVGIRFGFFESNRTKLKNFSSVRFGFTSKNQMDQNRTEPTNRSVLSIKIKKKNLYTHK